MVPLLAAAVLAVLLGVALLFSIRADRRPAASAPTTKLPIGADAAIWSIVEAVPDPRNHLALTRDLTGEVRITGTPLDPAFRSPTTGASGAEEPTPNGLWGGEPVPVLQLDDDTLDLRTFERAS
jgi:hypothetical protein